MNANTEIDLTTLQDAIVSDIKAAFPALATVQFYRGETDGAERKAVQTPACILELSEFEADDDADPGTGQLAVVGSFDAELIIGFRTERAKHSIRHLAAALAAWLHKRRWTNPADPARKLPTGEAMVVGAYPDDFKGGMSASRETNMDQFEVWRVEWRQRMHLGQTVWTDEGVTPADVFVRPNVNKVPDGDYQQVDE